jgi:hypothetical protein
MAESTPGAWANVDILTTRGRRVYWVATRHEGLRYRDVAMMNHI